MSNITNDMFIKFIESFSINSKYFDTITEISRSKTGPKDPLIRNDFKMFSLDDICADSKSFGEFNTPKTTDALWYKEENGKLTLYIIEFKFYSLDNSIDKRKIEGLRKQVLHINNTFLEDYRFRRNLFNENFFKDFEKFEKYFGNTVDFSLKMKPVETLIYVLPELYKEYCGFNDERDAEDCREFLKGVEKKLYVFLMKESIYDIELDNERIRDKNKKSRGRYKENKSKQRGFVNGSGLHKQYIRFKHANIINDYKIKANRQFKKFLEEEHLISNNS
ncbi:hypothetical protein [uncultured Methanobrevibacter sp.]|uniref:hypothetical protein n=1 Tax=uncultured Methanobrevibacter sp. TaxID=253161 RepID=UPI0025CCEB4A|nr:hypothetical protein [uncultured Methanobrevibacter sp.]